MTAERMTDADLDALLARADTKFTCRAENCSCRFPQELARVLRQTREENRALLAENRALLAGLERAIEYKNAAEACGMAAEPCVVCGAIPYGHAALAGEAVSQ